MKSKRRSSGRLTARQRLRETSVFYLDENLSECRSIHLVLDSASIKYERHYLHFTREQYPDGAPDHIWLDFVGSRGWIVLTKDKAQRYNPLEKAQLQKYRIKQFAFQSGNLSAIEMAEILRTHLNKMFNLIMREPPPFVASLTKSGVSLRTINSN
jgi:hypothetical protein